MGAVSFVNVLVAPWDLRGEYNEVAPNWIERMDEVWKESGEFLERVYGKDDLDRYCDRRGIRVGNDPGHRDAPKCLTGVARESGLSHDRVYTEKDFEFYARVFYTIVKLTELFPTEFVFGWSEGGHLDDVIGYMAEDGYFISELIITQGRITSFLPRVELLDEVGEAEPLEWNLFESFSSEVENWNKNIRKWMEEEICLFWPARFKLK